MKTIDHTLEIAYKSSTDGTEINVNKHKEWHKKADDYMNEIIYFQTAASKKFG